MRTIILNVEKQNPTKQTDFPADSQGLILALGYFDGVHRGHSELLRRTLYEAQSQRFSSAVFSFDVPPQKRQASQEGFLQTLEEKKACLKLMGFDHLLLAHFDTAFKSLEPQCFLDFLRDEISATLGKTLKGIVVGENFFFGVQRKGDQAFLETWCNDQGISLIVEPLLQQDGEVISSSSIRQAILSGNLKKAHAFLGRPYSLKGEVIHGEALGRRLDIPTANFRIEKGKLCPPYGVYISRVCVDGVFYEAISSFGIRPTVKSLNSEPLMEVHLLGTRQELYGKQILLELLDFLRPEECFDTIEAMQAQIVKDIKKAKAFFNTEERMVCVKQVDAHSLCFLKSQRFHSLILECSFFIPFEKDLATKVSLLEDYLTSVTQDYPTRSSLGLKLNELYGLNLDVSLSAAGNLQLLRLRLIGLRSDLEGNLLLPDYLKILEAILFNPLIEDGCFSENILEAERQSLEMSLRSVENDYEAKALKTALEKLAPNSMEVKDPQGELEELKKITKKDLLDTWHFLLTSCASRFLLAGSISDEMQDEMFDTFNLFLEKSKSLLISQGAQRAKILRPQPAFFPRPFSFDTFIEAEDFQDLAQESLVMIYRSACPYISERFLELQLLATVLSSDSSSLLFKVLREENGLVYNVSSYARAYLKALFITAGVQGGKVFEARDLTQKVMNDLAKGILDDETFDFAKKSLKNTLCSLKDDLASMVSFETSAFILGDPSTIDDKIRILHTCKKEQILEQVKHLELVCTYSLRMKPDDEI